MAITPYLAMTAAEFQNAAQLPPRIAWMACHFSPYATGLSNLPDSLPPDSLLILNDITPIHGHDPNIIAQQLGECIQQFQCCALLLDFQRVPDEQAQALTAHLLQALPCPVAVSNMLAANFSCPVFLPPCPPYRPLQEHLMPWQGRDIWLDTALNEAEIILSDKGAEFLSNPRAEPRSEGFHEPTLHCHYEAEICSQKAHFSLWRTASDLESHLLEAESLGITQAVGLYQELHNYMAP